MAYMHDIVVSGSIVNPTCAVLDRLEACHEAKSSHDGSTTLGF